MRKILSIVAAFVVGLLGFSSYAAYEDEPSVSVYGTTCTVTLKSPVDSYTLPLNVTNPRMYITGESLSEPVYITNSTVKKTNTDFSFPVNLEDGSYTLTIPEGYISGVYTNGWNTNLGSNMEFQIPFTVGGDTPPPAKVYTYTLTKDRYWQVTVGGASSIKKGTGNDIKLVNTDTNQEFTGLTVYDGYQYGYNIIINGTSTPNRFQINLDANPALGLTDGSYKLVVGEGYFKFDNDPCPAFEVSGIPYEKPNVPATSQEATLSPLRFGNKLYITFREVNGLDVYDVLINESQPIVLNTENGPKNLTFGNGYTVSNPNIILDINSFIESGDLKTGGTYTIKLPAGLVSLVSELDNEEVKYLNLAQDFSFVNAEISETNATWDPAEVVTFYKNSMNPNIVRVSWGGAELTKIEGAPSIKAKFTDFNSSSEYNLDANLSGDMTALEINLSDLPALAAGEYYNIDVPVGYVKFTETVEGQDEPQVVVNNTTDHSYGLQDASNIAITFNIMDGEEEEFEIGNPWQYVQIINETAEEPVTLDGAQVTYPYEGTNIIRIQADDFDYGVVVEIPNEGNYTLSDDEGVYYLEVNDNTGALTVNVKVYTAEYLNQSEQVTCYFNIYPAAGSDIENASQHIEISYFDPNTYQEVEAEFQYDEDSAVATVETGWQVTVAPKEGYMITELSTYNTYAVISQPAEDNPTGEWMFYMKKGAGDFASFEIKVAEAPKEATPDYVTFNFVAGSDLSDPAYTYVRVQDYEDFSWHDPSSNTMELTFVPGNEYKIFVTDYNENYEITVSVSGTDEDNYNLKKDGTEYYLTFTEAAGGAEVTVTVYNEGEAPKGDTIERVSLSFNIYTEDPDITNPSEDVVITYYDRDTFKTVTVNPKEGADNIGIGWMFEVTPAEGYKVADVVCYTGTITVSEPREPNGAWSFMVNEDQFMDFGYINISIAKADPMVTIDFGGDVYNAINYVNVTGFDPQSSEGNHLYIGEDGTATFSVSGAVVDGVQYVISNVIISKDGEEIANLTPNARAASDLENYGCTYTYNDGTFTFTLTPASEGLTFEFIVTEGTLKDGNEITLNFEGVNFTTPEAYTTVNVMADAIKSVNVDSNSYTYTYTNNELLDLLFTPEEGYTIEVSCVTAQGENYGQVIPQTESANPNAVQLSLPGYTDAGATVTIPTGLVVTILVTDTNADDTLAGTLTPEDIEIAYVEDAEGTVNDLVLPIMLDVTEGTMTYKGYQFDITLPEFLTVNAAAVGEALTASSNVPVSFGRYPAGSNTWRVVALLNESTKATGNIANLTLTYNKEDLVVGDYPAVIVEDAVFFSTVTGDDITDIKGATGTISVVDETNYTTGVEFGDVTLNKPSYTYPEVTDVDAVTQGEGLVMEVEISTADDSKPNDQALEFTITIGDEEITGDDVWDYIEWDPETGNWIFNTDDIDASNGDVTVKVTATSGDFSAEYEFTVRGILLGDSNFNGEVTVADVVTTANYVASLNSTRFDWINANVILNDNDPDNDDITVQDVTATVQIVLGTFDDNRNPVQSVRRQARTMVSSDYLTVADFKVKDNNPFMIGVNLENTNSYSAIQAVVEVPAGMTVKNVTAGPRAANHKVIYNITDNGTVNVVMYSNTNAAFAEIQGSLFNLEVVADEDCGNIRIEKIRAADAQSNGYELSCQGGENVTGTTGIDGIDAENSDVRYFTVDGLEIVNPQAGQIVIRVEGNKAEKVVIK